MLGVRGAQLPRRVHAAMSIFTSKISDSSDGKSAFHDPHASVVSELSMTSYQPVGAHNYTHTDGSNTLS